MKTFERLAKRIENDLGFKIYNPYRTYYGFHQKSAGAWTWAAYKDENNFVGIGSCFTATELLKSKKPLKVHKCALGIQDDEIICEN